MSIKASQPDNAIRGSCSFFVCKCCRTKYGWEHQPWCGLKSLTEPECKDCRYFKKRNNGCSHPMKSKLRKGEYVV